ncbi:replication factor A protein 2 [Apophysomyces sp. BC1034]|nr:replication factor A protein 2 [Apophysomyces sp. BC1015]KAG0176063.1 replication factor A protein 2 [Apophysomyces sp. BC1021]KAG0185780.1 replication factor A protein 2 [Apophysomyces sp. BC1034]
MSDSVNSQKQEEDKYKDCLPCKITGAAAFSGLGAYAFLEASKIYKIPGKTNTAVGLGVAGSRGGFMDSGSTTASVSRKPMGEQTLRPVTLKQLRNAQIPQDGSFKIDGADVTQVTFVAVIRQVQEMTTNFSYTMEDGTGVIEVRRWVESNETAEETQRRRELVADLYVRVYGRLNNFNNRISCIAFAIRPITDFNEISFHFLDAIHTHVSLTKTGSDTDAVMGQASLDVGSGGGSDVHKRVIDAVKMYQDREEGASVDQIIQKLQGVYNESVIRDAIEYLTNEGHCYTTIDDYHIKSTESY